MMRNAGILIMACTVLCFTLHSTFPLDRFIPKSLRLNVNKKCAHRRIKDTTAELTNDTQYISDVAKMFNKSTVSEDDLRRYEQLVIMKKYPYLDLNEFEVKYRPYSNKNVRQSIRFQAGKPVENDPSICEPIDDSINVEIINRGLTGFAIPIQLSKNVQKDLVDSNVKIENVNALSFNKKTPENTVLRSLKEEINAFIESKHEKIS